MKRKVPLREKGHTAVVTDEHGTKVILYSTVILAFKSVARQVTLNSGGWRTKTTKERINQALSELHLPAGVYQNHNKWYVWYTTLGNRSVTREFEDGMRFSVGKTELSMPITTDALKGMVLGEKRIKD